jgi:hypothetical protein
LITCVQGAWQCVKQTNFCGCTGVCSNGLQCFTGLKLSIRFVIPEVNDLTPKKYKEYPMNKTKLSIISTISSSINVRPLDELIIICFAY